MSEHSSSTFAENLLDPIRDVALPDSEGAMVVMRDLWSDSNVVLVWLRHYACTFCRSYVTEISNHVEEIEALGARVAGIGMGGVSSANAFKREWKVTFPILVDEQQITYQALELIRGRFVDVYGARVLLKGARNSLRGFPQGQAQQDARQLGGVVVVQEGGDIRYVHRARFSGDDVPVRHVLTALA